MKRLILICITSLICFSLSAQNYETVTEFKTEKELG